MKTIPFLKEDTKKKGSKDDPVIESGSIGKLEYTVYKRGVIHITNKEKNLIFKKDCTLFEEALTKLNLNNLKEDESKDIPGSGDNDTLVFTCKNGDIEILLQKPEYSTVSLLKKILKKGKK